MMISSVTIPEGVTEIGASAFASTKGLASVELPSTVTALGSRVFEGSSISTAELDGTFTAIPSYAFSLCENLNSITWQDGVTDIGDYAFQNANKLKEIDLTGIVNIGNYAFNPDSSKPSNGVYKATFSEGLKTIGNFAFADSPLMGNQGTVTLPSTVTAIGQQAFKGCKNIAKINIPGGVEVISSGAFRECSALVEVTIGEGVKTISSAAFMLCSNLDSITIPASVTSIADSALSSCDIVYVNCAPTATIGRNVIGHQRRHRRC